MRNLPNITKNLLLINLAVWLIDSILSRSGIPFFSLMALFPLGTPFFKIWQPFTYMFMHAGFSHLFCNMFAVLMFGPVLEREWGERKFLFYYLFCGVGAGLIQLLTWYIGGVTYASTVGASGAVFGILLAFGWLFPDVEMFLLFLPIPIRARTFVGLYVAFELIAGIYDAAGDNVAHFAHLGGALFGLILLLIWRSNITNKWNDLWHKLTGRSKHPRLDSSKDKDYSGYHYQKRV